MADVRQIGYITKNVQGNRVYDSNGIGVTLASQTGGLGGKGVGLYVVDDSKTEGERNMTKTNEITYEGKPFNYVSLFSGIGGFETALNRLGGNCVLASEIDKFANQSYEALYGHPTAGDITQIQAEDVPDHDVLVGGFPCQAFSVAGKRLGFDDTRGTLFFEVARLAKTKQPRAILLENVKGLVGHDGGKTLDVIVQTLNDIGYHVDFNVLNSKYFGVPQNRERIFIVALRDDVVEPADWIIEGTNVMANGKRRLSEYEGIKTFNFDWPEQDSVTTRLRDVLEPIVDERYYLSEEKTAKLVAQLEETSNEIIPEIEYVGMYDDTKLRTNGKPKYLEVYGVLNTNGQCNALKTMSGGGHEPKIAEEQGLPIREATKKGYAMAAVGDAVNFQFPDSNTRRGRVGKQIANTLEASNINQGVVEPNMLGHIDLKGHDAIKRVYDPQAISPTLTTMGGGHREPKIAEYSEPRYRIRKLTPLECWRLQGFTDEQHQTVVDAGLSDSQRYKQAGNAVTVNVIQAIGKRLLTYI